MLDALLKVLASIAFVASLAVLAFRVPHPSLIIVLAVVTAMLVYDFFVRAYLERGNGS